MATAKPVNIDAYIAGFPENTQRMLEQMRSLIRKAAPEAEETIRYAIPAYTLHGGRPLIYFAGFKNHVSLYPAPRGNEAFEKELSVYPGGKGTVQFPLGKRLPLSLIVRIVRFRKKEIEEKAAAKKRIKKAAGR